MSEHAGPVRARLAVLATTVLVALGVTMTPARALTAPAATVLVDSRRVWTSSGLTVTAGDTISVHATGFVHFGDPPIDRVGPNGVPWGAKCSGIATVQGNWPVGGLACWSLVGRVGTGSPFELGSNGSVRAATSGPLLLGINDNLLSDNFGSWPTAVTITAAPVSVPAKVPVAHTKSSTNAWPWILVLLAVVALGALIVLVLRRRREEKVLAFQLPAALRAATVEVRVTGDGSIQRRDDANELGALVVGENDFEDVHVARTLNAFAWHGWELRVATARLPLTVAHGEAFRHGQCVIGSRGMIPTDDGYTKAVLPKTFAASWVFALRSVLTPPAAETTAEVDGTLTLFVFGDQELAPQVDKLLASLDTLPAQLPALIARLPEVDAMLATRIVSDLPRA
jgi:hypothetical protein